MISSLYYIYSDLLGKKNTYFDIETYYKLYIDDELRNICLNKIICVCACIHANIYVINIIVCIIVSLNTVRVQWLHQGCDY